MQLLEEAIAQATAFQPHGDIRGYGVEGGKPVGTLVEDLPYMLACDPVMIIVDHAGKLLAEAVERLLALAPPDLAPDEKPTEGQLLFKPPK